MHTSQAVPKHWVLSLVADIMQCGDDREGGGMGLSKDAGEKGPMFLYVWHLGHH